MVGGGAKSEEGCAGVVEVDEVDPNRSAAEDAATGGTCTFSLLSSTGAEVLTLVVDGTSCSVSVTTVGVDSSTGVDSEGGAPNISVAHETTTGAVLDSVGAVFVSVPPSVDVDVVVAEFTFSLTAGGEDVTLDGATDADGTSVGVVVATDAGTGEVNSVVEAAVGAT